MPQTITTDTEALLFIGLHTTENYVDFGPWKRLVYHLVRSAVEQRGVEFAERGKACLLIGNRSKRGMVLNIFRQATAAARIERSRDMATYGLTVEEIDVELELEEDED